MTPTQVDDADLYGRAAELIEERGWFQGGSGRKSGRRLCFVLALREAMREADVYDPAIFTRAQLWLGLRTPDALIRWQDEPGRTEFDVIDTLRHIAKEIRNGQAP